MAPKPETPSSTQPAPPPSQHLGPVLVTGGCGFLGFHLVGKLLADPGCGPVCVLDRDVTRNTHDNPQAAYVPCDITDAAQLAAALDRFRPRVIFHAASPNATYSRSRDFYGTNVAATEALLRLAKERPFVRALVYTSSNSVYATTHKHGRVRESEPTWTGRPAPWRCVLTYAWTKGQAHNLVLGADESRSRRGDQSQGRGGGGGSLRTCAVVPANIYGTRDGQALSLMFDLFLDPRRPLFQVGGGQNLASFVEVGNCADLHVLAAKALLEGRPGVGGEAFNAADGEDVLLWWHTRVACEAIRGGEGNTRVRVIPAWVMCAAVHVVWWVLLVFTLGFVEPPPALSVEGYQWCTQDHTYDIRKARRVLGYAPRSGAEFHESVVRGAVEWEKERRRRVAAAAGGGRGT